MASPCPAADSRADCLDYLAIYFPVQRFELPVIEPDSPAFTRLLHCRLELKLGICLVD